MSTGGNLPSASGSFRAHSADSPEHGLFRIKPSAWWVFHEGWPTWFAVALVVAGTFAAYAFTDLIEHATRIAVFQFGLAAILFRVVYDVLNVLAAEFVLTDRRITARHGFVHPVTVELALEEIEEVELRRSPLQRLTGTGTLLFHVEGIAAPMAAWEYVRKPAEVREAVQAAVDRMRRLKRPGDR